MKLTIRTIATIQPDPTRETCVWDDDLAGFGIRVKPSGVKSFMVQYRNAGGISRRVTLGKLGVLTPEEARRMAKERLGEVAKGNDPAEARAELRKAMTVKQLCEAYLEAAEKGLILGKRGSSKKASTLYVDRGRITRHIMPLLGNRRVSELTTPDINRFMRDVAAGKTAVDVKTKLHGRSIVAGGSGTAARTVGLLGGILSYAVSEGVIAANPVRGTKRPADKRREVRLSLDQYQALGTTLKAAEEQKMPWQVIAAIKLLALTGCRRGEIENLRWAEVDLKGQCLRLSESKTGKSIRPLGSAAANVLEALPASETYVLRRGPAKPVAKDGAEKSDQVTVEKPFTGLPKAWERMLKLAAETAVKAKAAGKKMADISDLTPHGLRHGFASMGADLGLTEITIGALLGHSTASITGRYIHHVDTALVAAADRVAARIAAAMDETQERADVVQLRA